MAKSKGKGKGSGLPQGYQQVIDGLNRWNTNFEKNSAGAIEYGQNNSWSDAALPWVQGQLSGDMSTNPWMSRLFGSTGYGQDESLDYLREFLGGAADPTGAGVGRPGLPRDSEGGSSLWGNTGGNSFRYASNRGGTGPSTDRGGGDVIPDSTMGGPGPWSDEIKKFMDESRLDPMNDPTFKPALDAMQNETLEEYYRGVTDLVNQAEAGGRYGTGMYQSMRGQAFDEFSEANAQAASAMASHARDQALQQQMEALGLVNTRDIAAGQISAQERMNSANARASGNASQAALDAQMADAAQARRLQAIQMMMGAGQFDMGLQGNMGQLMQQGQLGALQAGLGFGQLGMSGYQTAQGDGQLGLGSMDRLGQIYGNAAQQRMAQQRMAEEQRRWQDGAPMRDIQGLLGILGQLNNQGGYEDGPGYVPGSPGPSPGGFDLSDIIGSIFAGGGTMYS